MHMIVHPLTSMKISDSRKTYVIISCHVIPIIPDRSSAIVLRIIISISTLTLIVQVYNLKGNPYNYILIFVFIASLIATRSFNVTNKNR